MVVANDGEEEEAGRLVGVAVGILVVGRLNGIDVDKVDGVGSGVAIYDG
eukprot:CAMPEP_0170094914 /NCGR_PEP_ID=MMETSP0019_2-20121128/27592_1 /TAXON_ID=98059 /ORGANISM="Dinobryon sp., Strain UTEXLB2267" /LENGTH=48 /DNA_ID= /DNA_START= /DNA_END= /DNA_ORIENTATION=